MAAVKCARLTRGDKKTVTELNLLLQQLSSSSHPMTMPLLRVILKNKNFYLAVLRDDKKIVGMGSILMWHAPTGLRSRIEDVVVDESYRGRGFGALLTEHLIVAAKKAKAKDIELSSRPSRIPANALYKKLGFEQKETNVYQMKFQK